MDWQPDQNQLRQLAVYLRDSLNGRDPAAQRTATQMLSQAKTSPDITNYLTCILSGAPSSLGLSDDQVHLARTSAAITLKNVVKSRYRQLSEQNQTYMRNTILEAIQDPNQQIRNFSGNVITEIVRQGGVMGWPEVFLKLLDLGGNKGGNVLKQAQEGAISALAKICEDNKKQLDQNYNGSMPLDVIVPGLYNLTSSENARVRALALDSINTFIPQMPSQFQQTIETLLTNLFRLAQDSDDDVRRNVCRSFVRLVEVKPEVVLPHMQGLVTYMITQQRNTDDPVLALDAAEFWLSIGENDAIVQALGPYLNQVIPTLLESMVYSEDDIIRHEMERDDAEEEDEAKDIKPQFAKSKRVGVNGSGGADGSTGATDGSGAGFDDDGLSEGEIEESADDDEDEEDPEDEWNLRKCSAAALDVLATRFHEPVFEVSLPYLKNNLQHAEWPNREAAVLAIGAVADGCMEIIAPHLPEIVPYLLSLLNDKEPVVRKITCWALGRYTRWAMKEEHRNKFFEPMMEGILQKMLDKNKSVQEGAASAFSNLEDSARWRLTPYCKPILQHFVKCFDIYKDRNMYILYDCIQTLAEHVGPGLAVPELIDTLMPALIRQWQKAKDQSYELFPLLECLSYVATALRESFTVYAEPIFERCVRLVHQNLEQFHLASENEAIDEPNKDFLVTSLDLLSAVIGALPPAKSSELVEKSQPKLFDLLAVCLTDANQDVRQSSYALLGDCAANIFPLLRPVLPSVFPRLIEQLNLGALALEAAPEAVFAVVNNACWSCGEIARLERDVVAQHFDVLYARLMAIVRQRQIPQSVNENAAITVGRLGLLCSAELAPHLPDFAGAVLQTLEPVEDTEEKSQALLGFNRVVARNPQGLANALQEYLKAAAYFAGTKTHEPGAADSFKQVISGYKTMLPNFSEYLNRLSMNERQMFESAWGS